MSSSSSSLLASRQRERQTHFFRRPPAAASISSCWLYLVLMKCGRRHSGRNAVVGAFGLVIMRLILVSSCLPLISAERIADCRPQS